MREVLTNNLEVKKMLMLSPHPMMGIRIHVDCSSSLGRKKKKTGSGKLSKWEWITLSGQSDNLKIVVKKSKETIGQECHAEFLEESELFSIQKL